MCEQDALYIPMTPCDAEQSQNQYVPSTSNMYCSGQTLICTRGYTGPTCDEFMCFHNCSSHGKCVGPNVCECDADWQGTYCSVSACPLYTSCATCTASKECGWCDETRECMLGASNGSTTLATCSSWFFYNCYTVDHR